MTKSTGVGRGGWRPGAGRKPKPKPEPADRDAAVLDALREIAGGTVDLKQRLDRLERVGAVHNQQLAHSQETLGQILRHQAAVARQLGAIEMPQMPRINRKRPLE